MNSGSTASQVVIQFSDYAPASPSDYAVAVRTNLTSGAWVAIGGAFSQVGGDQWQGVVTLPENFQSAFFRVTKNGVPITASFNSSFGDLIEGSSNPGLTVLFDGPFSGQFQYAVDYHDGAAPSTNTVSGTGSFSLFLPVSLPPDDSLVLPDRAITVILNPLAGQNYLPGGDQSITVIVRDNDSLWDGILDDGTSGIAFSMRMLSAAGVGTAAMISNGDNLIPAGTNTLTSFTFAISNQFHADYGPVVIPAERTPLGEPTDLTISFQANYSPDTNVEDTVESDRVVGNYLMTTSVAGKPFLTQTNGGIFRMIKRIIAGTEVPQ
ncbi:hypothetical protein GC207_12485 [bacterium]|nr:hypothetical protein [bacterium]